MKLIACLALLTPLCSFAATYNLKCSATGMMSNGDTPPGYYLPLFSLSNLDENLSANQTITVTNDLIMTPPPQFNYTRTTTPVGVPGPFGGTPIIAEFDSPAANYVSLNKIALIGWNADKSLLDTAGMEDGGPWVEYQCSKQ